MRRGIFFGGLILFLGLGLAWAGGAEKADFAAVMAGISKQVEMVVAKAEKSREEPKVAASPPPLKAAETPANLAQFILELDEKGFGRAETRQRCFGVVLKCIGRVLAPEATYQLRVATDSGSEHEFEKVASGEDVSFELKTKGGLSKTTFILEVKALEPPPDKEAQLQLAYSF